MIVGSLVYIAKLIKEPVEYPEGMIDIATMPLSSTQIAPHDEADRNYERLEDKVHKDNVHWSDTVSDQLDKIKPEFDPRVYAWYNRPEYSEPIARPYFNQYNPINVDA